MQVRIPVSNTSAPRAEDGALDARHRGVHDGRMAQDAEQRAARTAQDHEGTFKWKTIGLLAGVPFVLLAVGIASTVVKQFPGPDGGLQWLVACLGGIAIWTFIAFYNDSGDIRTAIAASVMLTYFSSLFVIALVDKASVAVSAGGAKTALDGFQNLVVIVVGFYITGKTVESVATHRTVNGGGAAPDGAGAGNAGGDGA